jgi:hypothetical protein
MSEEQTKKPKIDLKARLGRKSVPGGSSIPPPGGAIPKPVGIPAPPFAQKGPKVDASDPYAAIHHSEAPARVEPQAIKVEMSEEVLQAQKKGRSKVIALAGVTAVVGGFLGFVLGGRCEADKGTKAALSGASALVKEVGDANAKIEELIGVLDGAKQKLASSKYPTEELQKLGGINIPFDGTNLAGKGIGRFQGSTVKMLVDYAHGAQGANERKDDFSRILTATQKSINDLFAQQTEPKVMWGAIVQPTPVGPWVTLALLPEPFAVKGPEKDGKAYAWPEKLKLKDGQKDIEFSRYAKGDPIGAQPPLIPVSPAAAATVCPNDVLSRVRRELVAFETILKGAEGQPGGDEERQGLLDLGRKLEEQLKGIGAPKK